MTDNVIFKPTDTLLGHTSFNDFEQEFDGEIFYADGCENSVIEALKDCEVDLTNQLEFYYFDNWAVAMFINE